MNKFNKKNIITFFSANLPQRYVIAASTSDLFSNIHQVSKGCFESEVIAVTSGLPQQYYDHVNYTIQKDFRSDYMDVTDYINSNDIKTVSLQHEFGLFGGQAGSYIISLLRGFNVFVYRTLLTIFKEP